MFSKIWQLLKAMIFALGFLSGTAAVTIFTLKKVWIDQHCKDVESNLYNIGELDGY